VSDTSYEYALFDTYSGGPLSPFFSAPPFSERAKVDLAFSGLIDPSTFYTTSVGDFFAKSFSSTWATAFGDIYYKDVNASLGMSVSGISPSVYNSSIQSSGPAGATAATLSGIAASCGWTITPQANNGGGGFIIFRGQAKLDSTVTQAQNIPFWIGLATIMNPNQPWWDANGNEESFTGTTYGSHGSWPTRTLAIVRQGVMNGGDVIANESSGQFNLPFPAQVPFPIQAIADSPIVAQFYFVVIGQDPAGWAKQYGYKFAVSADNANITADSSQTI